MKLGNQYFWTNSELSEWRRCLRKGYLNNVLKLKPLGGGRLPEWGVIGNTIHDALATYYIDGGDLVALALTERDKLLDKQNAMLVANAEGVIPLPMQNLVTQNVETINTTWDLIEKMLQGYVQWLEEEGEDDGMEVLSAEEEVYAPIKHDALEGDHYLLGKLDMRVYDKRINARAYIDHKSVQSFIDKEKTAHIDPQFLFYGLLEYLQLLDKQATGEPDWIDRGILNMLKKSKRTARAKPPFYKRYEVRHNRTQLEKMYVRTLGEILTLMQRIAAYDEGTDPLLLFPPNVTKDCSWDCQYFALCPMLDDGSDFQGYIDTQFMLGNPLERYLTIPQEG